MNLYVEDIPLWYDPPIGPSVKIHLSYNSQATVSNDEAFGSKWQFNYGSRLTVDPNGTVTVFMPDGRQDVYNPDGIGGYIRPYRVLNELTRIADNNFELRFPDDTIYSYNIPSGTNATQSFLVEIRDAHGQHITFGYNVSVQITTITDAMDRVTNFTYNGNGLVTQVTDPFGRSAYFEYSAGRDLTKITDMGGYWSTFSYDANVYLASIGNERGTWGFYIEPSDGITGSSIYYPPPGDHMWDDYRITITNPLGEKEEYYYFGHCDEYNCGYTWYVSPRDYMTWRSDDVNNFSSRAPKTRYFFEGTDSGQRGEISQIINPEGGSISYGYDPLTGNRTSVTDYHGHTTNYTYNGMNQATFVTDAKGAVTTMTYASNGVDLLMTQDGLGTVTNTYNSTHDITSITDRLGNKTSFTFNSFGQIESRKDAEGVFDIVTTYSYDADHRLQQITKDGKTLESFTYDTIDRIRTRTDATGLTLTYDYNNLNNITKITYPDGKYASYAYSGCCPYLKDSETDRSGRTTYYKYDALRRLRETINPEGGSTKNKYDANGNLIKLIDPNSNVTAFEYDLDNRLRKKIFSDGKFILFTYDRAGLLTARTNARGINTNYSYDQNHNTLSISYSDGTPGVTYQYDNYNRVTQRQDGIGAYQFSYDANSRLLSVNGPWANDTLTYQYDALGRKTSLTPQGGQTVSYNYDILSRLTGIQTGTNTYSYSYVNANPQVQNLTRPNGSITNYSYDTLNRLTEISNKNSALQVINRYVYAYNQQDLRSGETITNGNPITSFQNELITYDYNKVNQLLTSTNPSKNFIYDDDGNMINGYTPEGYVFVAAYDAENRLKSLQYADIGGVVHKTEYLYSGNSFLAEMKKYDNTALISDTRFVRDGLLALQERDASNNVTREYTWGIDMGGGIGGLLNLRQGGQEYSYLYDGKGNVTALIDSAQSVVATYTYDTFGNLMSKTGSLNQPFQFSTKPYDEKTGLSYYGYRFYSPAIGRWINRDPLGEEGGINLYGFVGGNPVTFKDPNGEMPQVLIGAMVGGVIGGVTGIITRQGFWQGFIGGAVTGALISVNSPISLATAAGGAASQFTREVIAGTLNKPSSVVRIGASALIGGVTGPLVEAAGGGIFVNALGSIDSLIAQTAIDQLTELGDDVRERIENAPCIYH
jgi:RHS repeat-associated protein